MKKKYLDKLSYIIKLCYSFSFFKSINILYQLKIKKSNAHFKINKGVSVGLRYGTTDYEVFTEVFLDKCYNIEEVKDAKYIIDAGSNIGLTSLFYKNKYKNAFIIGLEPELNNYNIFKKHTSNFKDIIALNCALWYKDTNLELVDLGYGDWGFRVKESILENDFTTTVKAVTINSIINDYKLPYIDILKIDIEGSELDVFKKGDNLDWLKKTKYIIIETHDLGFWGSLYSVVNCLYKSNFVHIKAMY